MNLAKNIARSIVSPLSTRITDFVGGIVAGGGGGFLPTYPGAAGAYSLRSLTGSSSTKVVRLRRGSDSAEMDFTADELTGSVTGAELVTNGDFATDSDWTKGTGWSITGGQAVCSNSSGSNSKLTQNLSEFTAGGYFKMEFTIVAFSSNTGSGLRACTTTERGWSSYGITTAGTYTAILNASLRQLSDFQFWCGDGESLTIDNVSVKPYTPTVAELWALENLTSGTEPWADQVTETAYATTWYDQSGSGNDATQATAAAQPKLITAGVTELENGKPALVFDGVGDCLVKSSIPLWDEFTGVSVFTIPDNLPDQNVFDVGGGTSTADRHVHSLGTEIGLDSLGSRSTVLSKSTAFGTVAAVNDQTMYTHICQNSDSDSVAFNDGLSVGAGVGARGNNNDRWVIGGNSNLSDFWLNGTIQELVFYPSDQSANRIGIETNINDHYGIY